MNNNLWLVLRSVVSWITSSIGGALIIGVLGFVCRNAIVNWIKGSIQLVYDARLETMRAANARELSRLRSSLDTQQQLVSSAFLEARRASNDRRLDAIQTIWDSMMEVYFRAPSMVAMTNLFTTELYTEAFNHLRENIPDVLAMALQYGNPENNLPVEKARLLAGQYLYSLFWAYRAFHGSIALDLALSKEKGEFRPWWQHNHVLNLLRATLTGGEFEEFTDLKIEKYQWVTGKLEEKFLLAAEDIIDGRRAATEAFEQASEILTAAKNIAEKMSQSSA